jgi:putative transcriptional regulator
MSKINITNNIRRFRFDFDEMTQQILADKAGATRQTIHHIEKGKYSPSLELAFKIANVFKVPLEEVFQYSSEEQ